MSKTGVIVCSNAGLDYIDHAYDIPVFRSVVIFSENEKYDDYTEISAEDFYTRLKTDKKAFPHTAFCSLGKMIETYEMMKEKGYDSALVIVISSKLSSLYEAVQMAAKEVEDFTVTAYDSRSISYPQCYMAFTACEMFKQNASMEEVLWKLDFIRDNHHYIFAVDTLEFLIKNGRLSKVTGTFAQMLKIRPLLQIDKTGAISAYDKTRTSKKARTLMIEKYVEEIEGMSIIPFLIHGNADKEVLDECIGLLKQKRPDLDEVQIFPITPVVGSHAGPGVVAFGWIQKFPS